MKKFISKKTILRENLHAIAFYYNDSHIYSFADDAMRHSSLHLNDKRNIISLISKDTNKNKSERGIKVGIPFVA